MCCAQCFCRSEGVGSGWDAFLAAVRPATGRGADHRGLFEGVDVAVVADHGAGPVRSQATVICEAVTMSITSPPRTRVTATCADASSGGTE